MQSDEMLYCNCTEMNRRFKSHHKLTVESELSVDKILELLQRQGCMTAGYSWTPLFNHEQSDDSRLARVTVYYSM